jgi:uncharacterized protein
MKVDKRVIEHFNTWWRQRNHCEPTHLQIIEAFEAGFLAALEQVRKTTPKPAGESNDR